MLFAFVMWYDIIDQLMGGKLYQRKRKYCKISYKKRLTLIEMVENQKLGVSKAAKKLKIKIPTAKVILSTFRRKGIIFNKRTQPPKPVLEATSPAKQETLQFQNKESTQVQNMGLIYCPWMWPYGVGFEGMIHFVI